MRKIKFRGKSKKSAEWFYGNYFDKDISGRSHIRTINRGCLDIDPETVSQFTGLTDKNGKEIYDGDIIYKKWINGDNREEQVSFVIVFHDAGFCVDKIPIPKIGVYRIEYPSRLSEKWLKECELEIIGNIHDNPELLKNPFPSR